MTFGYQLICRPAITFLYSAPMIELNPLNTRAMADNYVENIGISDAKAIDMARMTKKFLLTKDDEL